jgi:phosphoenolpyruvate-protein kinase (PTS system EI component)
MNFNEWDISEKVLGGAGVVGMALVALQKAISFFRAEQSNQSSSAATTAQFKALQEAITATNKELSEVRAAFYIMDRKVHVQHRTITTLEMLVIRMMSLIKDNGVSVPAALQADLDEMTKALRNPEIRTRATDTQEPQE